MIKRRGESQIGNLNPNHKSLESMGQMKSDWSMLYTVAKIFSKHAQNRLDLKKM
jgi:hypothetical protein